MIRKLITLIITVSLLLLVQTGAAIAQPLISFESSSFDFGDAGQDEVLEHIFTFSNTGTEMLVIEKISSS